MSTDVAVEKRNLAKRAAEALRATDGIIGICVFGSVARGQANDDSDIDMLVLGDSPDIEPSSLYKLTPKSAREAGLSILYFTPDRLANHLRQASVFSLHLRRDGWIIFDRGGRLAGILQEDPEPHPRQEILRQRKLLRSFRHTERFGGRFLFPLSHVYRIGRTVTYAQLVDRQVIEFDQGSAFALLATLMPSWSQEIKTIERLSPFYARTRSRYSEQDPPFDPNGPKAEAEFVRAYNAVLTITGAGSESAE